MEGTGGSGGTIYVPDSVSSDAGGTCSYVPGTAPDGSSFNTVCPASGCPEGTICVYEVGGVGGGGGEGCAPIPTECQGTPTCECMAKCACTNTRSGRPEFCMVTIYADHPALACDDGIR